MLIEAEVSDEIDEILALFNHSPEKTQKAITRTVRKLGKWTERQVLRDLARRVEVSQKILKKLNRINVTINKTANTKKAYLTVWIGTNNIDAHYFGKPRQTSKGVRIGRKFFQGSFLLESAKSNRKIVFFREDNWRHEYRKSKTSGRWMYMGLPLKKETVSINAEAKVSLTKLSPLLLNRFSELLYQELNYAFNIES